MIIINRNFLEQSIYGQFPTEILMAARRTFGNHLLDGDWDQNLPFDFCFDLVMILQFSRALREGAYDET